MTPLSVFTALPDHPSVQYDLRDECRLLTPLSRLPYLKKSAMTQCFSLCILPLLTSHADVVLIVLQRLFALRNAQLLPTFTVYIYLHLLCDPVT